MTLPSVTQILRDLGLATDYSAVDPATLARARERGTLVHQAIRDHHMGLGETVKDWLPEAYHGYVAGYERFVAETTHEPILSEFLVTSTRWGFIGHPDRLAWCASRRTLYDWKTYPPDPSEVGWQLAGYKLAWDEEHPKEPVQQLMAVEFTATGTYRLTPIDPGPVLAVFQAAVVLWHAKTRRNGGPR